MATLNKIPEVCSNENQKFLCPRMGEDFENIFCCHNQVIFWKHINWQYSNFYRGCKLDSSKLHQISFVEKKRIIDYCSSAFQSTFGARPSGHFPNPSTRLVRQSPRGVSVCPWHHLVVSSDCDCSSDVDLFSGSPIGLDLHRSNSNLLQRSEISGESLGRFLTFDPI